MIRLSRAVCVAVVVIKAAGMGKVPRHSPGGEIGNRAGRSEALIFDRYAAGRMSSRRSSPPKVEILQNVWRFVVEYNDGYESLDGSPRAQCWVDRR